MEACHKVMNIAPFSIDHWFLNIVVLLSFQQEKLLFSKEILHRTQDETDF